MNILQFEAHIVTLAFTNGFPNSAPAWEALGPLPRKCDTVARLLFLAGKTDEILRRAMIHLDAFGKWPADFAVI